MATRAMEKGFSRKISSGPGRVPLFLLEVFFITSLKPLEESSTLPFELMNELQKRGWQEVNPCALFEMYGHTGAKASRRPLQSLRLRETFLDLFCVWSQPLVHEKNEAKTVAKTMI